MDKCDETPGAAQLAQNTNLAAAEVQSLLFVEPTPNLMPFTWREFKVSRCGFSLTHAIVRTSYPSQGKTCEQGVLIDCAKRDTGANATNPDDYWLHMYVMLSRTTSLQDLCLIRVPEATFLLQRSSSCPQEAAADVSSQSGQILEIRIVNRRPVGLPDVSALSD